MKVIAAFVILICISLPAAADHIVQILHTNDLHSFWESSEYEGYGGYARLKTLMDQFQTEGDKKGWITLRLDAGDFSGGNIDFLAEGGKPSFKLIRQLGYDVVAVGNHDYLTGMEDLASRFHDPDQRLPLVAANIIYSRQTGIEPGRLIKRGGLTFAIAGATVKSILWNWAAWPAQFIDPEKPVDSWLAAHPADLTIALTHLGYASDVDLAKNSRHIDVVVGGHTHTPLFDPLFATNKNHRAVPIVQAGSHGMYLGQLVLNVGPGHAPQLLHYELHPIDTSIAPAESVEKFITNERAELGDELHTRLDNHVARANESFYSRLDAAPLIGNFYTDAIREATNSDLAADSGDLYADRIPAGELTVNDIFNMSPHVYSWNYRGWTIFTCQVRPLSLAITLSYLASHGVPLAISGMNVHLDSADIVMNMTRDGKLMDLNRHYQLAMSEGFGAALATEPFLEKFLCVNVRDTGVLMRDALLAKAKAVGTLSRETLGPRRIVGGSGYLARQFR